MLRNIGKNFIRKEGLAKVTGRALYIDDLHPEGMIYGVTVRSKVARGVIRKIDFKPGVPWEEFTIVTHKDIPAKNVVALIESDQPYLVEREIRHPEEPVLLLAHPNRTLLEIARTLVSVEVDEKPGVFSIEEALAKKEIIWGKDNILKSYEIKKGDLSGVWSKAHRVVEGEYRTGAQEHLYIEPNGMIAEYNDRTGITIWGSMQCPYYVHKAVVSLFGFEESKIRIIQTETGGGFGGKEEFPSVIAGHAALLAYKSKKPVKIIYDRAEDMAATTKRHPSRTRIKTAHDKDGKILGADIDFVLDGGAYATLSSVVLSRGTIHASGPYEIENARVKGTAVATSHPPHGAFRGFGAPQSIFAWEKHLDHAAHELGITPEMIRRRNLISDGKKTVTGQTIKDKVDLNELLDFSFQKTSFHEKRAQWEKENRSNERFKKGIGFSLFFHGCGFTGSGERKLASVVGIEAQSDGKVRVLASSTEIGQGTNTIFSQIASESLNLDFSDIEVAQPDTGVVPNSGPTVASRTCMVVGKLVESACIALKQTLIHQGLLKENYSRADWKVALEKHLKDKPPLRIFSQYQPPKDVYWDDEKYQGDAYAAYGWGVYIAEVNCDLWTYETKIDRFTAVQEIGRVVHPVMAAGQIEGGVAQGIGYALFEECVWKNGAMINNRMTNYIIPTIADTPTIDVHFFESPTPHGPSGAKGIGELPMDGPAPAILNAAQHALNHKLHEIPLLPERLMKAIEAGARA